MSYSPDGEAAVWAAIGPDSLLDALAPLLDMHRRRGAVAVFPGRVSEIEKVVGEFGNRPAVLLVVEDPTKESIRTQYSAPFQSRAAGPDVLLGWVRLDVNELATYARRAAALLSRRDEIQQPVVLLGPRETRYLKLLDELERTVQSSPYVKSFQWSAERIRRGPVVDALRLGAAAVLYTGHGNALGWFAYGWLGADTFATGEAWSEDQASALMFSLSCRTGQPSSPRVPTPAASCSSFADAMIAHGVAGAVLAPLGDPLHTDNRLLANGLLLALASGRRSFPDILGAARSAGVSLRGYAVIGDPALRATSAPNAVSRGAKVFAPAADADLLLGAILGS